jgi:hypothetical protein
MRPSPRIACVWPVVSLGILVLIWAALTGLLIASHGKPEAYLAATFGRSSRPDAFEHLNGIAVHVWFLHSALVLLALLAVRRRRTDVLGVLLIGPVIALTIAILGQQWTDPNWFVVAAVFAIGSLVGAVVGGAYWMVKRFSCGENR